MVKYNQLYYTLYAFLEIYLRDRHHCRIFAHRPTVGLFQPSIIGKTTSSTNSFISTGETSSTVSARLWHTPNRHNSNSPRSSFGNGLITQESIPSLRIITESLNGTLTSSAPCSSTRYLFSGPSILSPINQLLPPRPVSSKLSTQTGRGNSPLRTSFA